MTATVGRFFSIAPEGPAHGRLEEVEQYFLAGNLNEALAAAQQAWRECPQEADVFRVLAYIHTARGEYPPAAQAAYQAVVIDGDNPASCATLAQVYLTFNMLPLADETLMTALQRHPGDPSLQVLLADVRFRQRQESGGLSLVHEALKRNADDAYAKALLGSHYLRKRDYDGAVMALQEAVVTYGQRWDYQRDLGIAALHTQQYAVARQALTTAFRLHPDDPATQQHLWLSLRLADEASPLGWYWRYALLLHHTPWLSTTLIVAIIALPLVGLIVAAEGDALVPGLCILAGASLLATAWSGLFLRRFRGEKAIERLERQLPAS